MPGGSLAAGAIAGVTVSQSDWKPIAAGAVGGLMGWIVFCALSSPKKPS